MEFFALLQRNQLNCIVLIIYTSNAQNSNLPAESVERLAGLPASLLEDDHLGVLGLLLQHGTHARATDQRATHDRAQLGANQQHLVQCYGVSNINIIYSIGNDSIPLIS